MLFFEWKDFNYFLSLVHDSISITCMQKSTMIVRATRGEKLQLLSLQCLKI